MHHSIKKTGDEYTLDGTSACRNGVSGTPISSNKIGNYNCNGITCGAIIISTFYDKEYPKCDGGDTYTSYLASFSGTCHKGWNRQCLGEDTMSSIWYENDDCTGKVHKNFTWKFSQQKICAFFLLYKQKKISWAICQADTITRQKVTCYGPKDGIAMGYTEESSTGAGSSAGSADTSDPDKEQTSDSGVSHNIPGYSLAGIFIPGYSLFCYWVFNINL